MRKTVQGTWGVLVGAALVTAGFLQAQDKGARSVTVKMAADRALEKRAEWRIATTRLVDNVFRTFRERFGIRLVLKEITTWNPGSEKRTLGEALGDLRKDVSPGKCDIVLGMVDPDHISNASLGVASYPFGYMLVKNVASREAMVYALLHEACHIFGAIDLREKGSVMGIEAPGFAVDAFTDRTVRLHKDRIFGGAAFPLSKAAQVEAVPLYAERARLGLMEPEAHLFLTLLYLEMDNPDAAAAACAEAVRQDPGFAGLYVLLGNISLKQGASDRAIDAYRKALGAQPDEAGIYYNLGLAYIQKGDLSDAATQFERALAVHPGYAQARQALDLLRGAGSPQAFATTGLEPLTVALKHAK